MTCKDCLHYEACTDMIESLGHTLGGDGPNAEKRCKCFTDRSEWVHFPCAIGKTVYRVMRDKRINKPYEYKVIGFWYSADEQCNNAYLVRYVNGVFESSMSIPFSEFGQIVFLTREEAEKALEGKKNGYG